jgi:hypothetical protein
MKALVTRHARPDGTIAYIAIHYDAPAPGLTVGCKPDAFDVVARELRDKGVSIEYDWNTYGMGENEHTTDDYASLLKQLPAGRNWPVIQRKGNQ